MTGMEVFYLLLGYFCGGVTVLVALLWLMLINNRLP